MKPITTLELGTKTIQVNGHSIKAKLIAKVYFDENFELDWDMQPNEKK